MAFPDVPGFKGQGWSTQETAMVVRWLFGDPAAWDQAMSTARAYPGNPHTVADTLHEQIVPRSELDAIVTAGGFSHRVGSEENSAPVSGVFRKSLNPGILLS